MNAEPLKIGEQQTVDLKDCILLGKLVGTWGVKGWLKVFSYTRPRNNIGQYKRWLLVAPSPKKSSKKNNVQKQDGISQVVTATSVSIKNCKEQAQNIVAHIDGINYRDEAEGIFGLEVYIEKSQLKPLTEGEFYWSDMIDCEVTNLQGESFGKVSSMMETGANDVLVVHQTLDNETIEHLIPYSDEIVLSVDVAEAAISVDWGLDYLVTEKNNTPRKKKQTKQERAEEIRLAKLALKTDAKAEDKNDDPSESSS